MAKGTKFGALLKSLRERRKVSQSKLAEEADFDHSYVSRLESGARTPSREAVDKLGKALQLKQQQLDSMLAAAGFLPHDFSSLLEDEPIVGEILDLLQDEAVPSDYRDGLRALLHLLVQLARFAVRNEAAQAKA